MAISRTTRAVSMLAVLVCVLGLLLILNPKRPAVSEKESSGSKSRVTGRTRDFATTPDAEVSNLIQGTLAAMRADPDQNEELLRKLREAIRQAPEEEAAAAIVAFLKSGDDVATGMPFAVGPEGMMASTPTLRLALLDLLPSLEPTAALELARETMDSWTTPDEYAISLRNMAWNDLDGDMRDELSGRFMDLLESPWLANPSSGLLESFDIAVEVGGKPMFDRLVTLTSASVGKSNPAVSEAAFISLDRMIVRNPALLTSALDEDPAWMDFAPEQRASLASRLDLANPEQRERFVRYLAAPHAPGELEYFVKLFPNKNYLHGHRLVTADEATPSIAEVSSTDARVLAELDAIEATATPDVAVAIQTVRERLKKSGAGR